MGIKRYYAEIDNTITNALENNLQTRGTGSNMGASDILKAFVIHGQTSASIDSQNAEQSRIILQFDMDEILLDIENGAVPSSSVNYFLKLYNAPHGNTTPLSYSLDVSMLKESWSEGTGLDMENYSNLGESNWEFATADTQWSVTGGLFYGVGSNDGANTYSSSFFFDTGLEDLELNVDFAVSQWRNNNSVTPNYGLIIKHTDPVISGALGTYYTKRFFGRTSEYFLKRPVLEARWDSSREDNRGNFFISSSLADDADNLNKLFLYNRVRGQLKNIPNLINDTLKVQIFTGSTGPAGSAIQLIESGSGGAGYFLTGGLLIENGVEISGVYTCSFASTLTGAAGEDASTGSYYDVWSTGSVEFHTGSFLPYTLEPQELIYPTEYITSITNLKNSYTQGEKSILRVFTRKKNWSPNIYTIANQDIKPEIIDSAYYRIFRIVDNEDVVSYGTGSNDNNSTKLSYDVSGNYFTLDTSYLDTGYSYGIQFSYNYNGEYYDQKEIFKFRIDEDI